MSEILENSISKWGLPNRLWRKGILLRNRTFRAPFGIDDPEKNFLGPDYWHTYPVEDFDYTFNPWGFRDHHNFELTRSKNSNQKVNICIGDSYTLNIGGPLEHSWPFLLSKYFDIPTLNLGVNGLSSYHFQQVIDKCRELGNVDKVFVLHNILDESVTSTKQIKHQFTNVYQSLDVLKKHHWAHGAYWQFIPPWTFDENELPDLYRHFPNAHDYLKNLNLGLKDLDVQRLLIATPIRQKYNEIAGPSWMSYDKFCQLYVCGHNMLQFFDLKLDKKLVQEFLTGYVIVAVRKILYTNRDSFHMNKQLNQHLADYFYHQSCTVKFM